MTRQTLKTSLALFGLLMSATISVSAQEVRSDKTIRLRTGSRQTVQGDLRTGEKDRYVVTVAQGATFLTVGYVKINFLGQLSLYNGDRLLAKEVSMRDGVDDIFIGVPGNYILEIENSGPFPGRSPRSRQHYMFRIGLEVNQVDLSDGFDKQLEDDIRPGKQRSYLVRARSSGRLWIREPKINFRAKVKLYKLDGSLVTSVDVQPFGFGEIDIPVDEGDYLLVIENSGSPGVRTSGHFMMKVGWQGN